MSRDPIVQGLDDLIRDLGELRTEAFRLKRLVLERFGHEFDDEKTPVETPAHRPKNATSSSQSAVQAFRASSDFLLGKKPP